jgi:hypothetical protein
VEYEPTEEPFQYWLERLNKTMKNLCYIFGWPGKDLCQPSLKSKSRTFTLHRLSDEQSTNNETVEEKSFLLELRINGKNKTQKIAQNALFSIF